MAIKKLNEDTLSKTSSSDINKLQHMYKEIIADTLCFSC
jgi:hypothetical protein